MSILCSFLFVACLWREKSETARLLAPGTSSPKYPIPGGGSNHCIRQKVPRGKGGGAMDLASFGAIGAMNSLPLGGI